MAVIPMSSYFHSGISSQRSGIHILRDQAIARRLVDSSEARAGELVVEVGAGTGVLTAHLARSGARVLAVERDARFVARLTERFETATNVRVISGDALTMPLPRRRFLVVANIPYGISTALVRRLLSPPESPLAGADLLVEWGFARRLTTEPRDGEIAWWQARYEISIAGRVPPRAFQPPPSVGSAHLVIRRRSETTRRDPSPPAVVSQRLRRLNRAAQRRPGRGARQRRRR